MNRKHAITTIMIIALFGMLDATFKIQKANGSSTIYIRSDGSIDPMDAPISSIDNITYTFTRDVINTIMVERNNIIVDGAGFLLQGNGGGYGIDISYRINVTIKNMNIKAFFNGIYLCHSLNNNITGNNITASAMSGIRLFNHSYYNTIYGNNITKNVNGVGLVDSVGNRIFENNIQCNGRNIELYGCYNNFIYHNNFMIDANQVQVYSYNKNKLLWDYWDSGYPSGGNYWNNHNNTDLFSDPNQNATGSDGIADSAVIINERNEKNRDHYPLMGMFYSFTTSYGLSISFISNSSIINPNLSLINQSHAVLSFNISGENQTQGFCRVCIPKALINGSYTVTFDNKTIDPQVRELPYSNATHEYLYINYIHSEHTIEIRGTTTIPELSQFVVFSLLIVTALLATIVCRKSSKLYKNTRFKR